MKRSILRALVVLSAGYWSASAATAIAQEKTARATPVPAQVTIPAAKGWKQLTATDTRTVWQGRPGNSYHVRVVAGKCDVPMDDVDRLRQHVRAKAKEWKGGMIEAKFMKINDRPCAFYIVKNTKPRLNGYRYLGRCIIPFEGGYHEIGMDTLPVGPTGRREAFLAVKLNLYGNVVMEEIPEEAPPTPGPGGQGKRRVKGLFRDPYDRKFDAVGNYWVTDDAKYDKQFPMHSLSRLRSEFPKVLKTIQVPQK